MTQILERKIPQRAYEMLMQQGVPPVLARLFAARGIAQKSDIEHTLPGLLPPDSLLHMDKAATLLADHIAAQKKLLIIADYDCDGATACAVGVRALRAMGARVDYLVPNRFEYGYGLSPEIARLAAQHQPDLLITVDNGIASVEGVAEARRLGMKTLVTDHHLPGDELPEAEAIVNPNQPGCPFPSKHLAGVGVMFYVMLALRAELRRRGAFAQRPEPNLATLLDLVALGTVADVVPLDKNNRILVAQGLKRMREGKLQPGVDALFRIAGRDPRRAGTFDLGFGVGPRLNAAGRLSDMSMGIETLISDDLGQAMNIAQELDKLNRERRAIEAEMQEQALSQLDEIADGEDESAPALVLFDPDWHQGVVGLLASRVKDKRHRPVIAFAQGDPDQLKGSGRSIPGLHLRDALDLVSKQAPGLILRFGGHAAAAGLTIREDDLPWFEEIFTQVVNQMLTPADLERKLETDGPLESGHMSLESARLLNSEIWGQAFPAPVFSDVFVVENQRVLKNKHLKLHLRKGQTRFDAIYFNHADPAPAEIYAAYRLDINEYNGVSNVQLVLEHLDAA